METIGKEGEENRYNEVPTGKKGSVETSLERDKYSGDWPGPAKEETAGEKWGRDKIVRDEAYKAQLENNYVKERIAEGSVVGTQIGGDGQVKAEIVRDIFATGKAGRNRWASESEKEPVRLMEDKWPQLWAIYPHIHPFQDEREYISLGPSDFVLFPENAYRAVNNSFLLHGYYNYRHLILGRVERKGDYCYYVGVPGNFYEREKQVAVMFGFESFECAEEPAQPGDFGYYMMRVQI